MGWLFGWSTRKELVKHLVEGNGIKTVRHCSVGNNLWALHEYPIDRAPGYVRFVCQYLIKPGGTGDWRWGYKDVDESMGPYDLSCPESYLVKCTAPINQHSYEFRQRVYALAERKRQMKIGSKWRVGSSDYTLCERVSPTLFRAKDVFGDKWRITTKQLLRGELCNV